MPIRTEPYLVALGDVGNNILDARSAHNRCQIPFPVDDDLNVFWSILNMRWSLLLEATAREATEGKPKAPAWSMMESVLGRAIF